MHSSSQRTTATGDRHGYSRAMLRLGVSVFAAAIALGLLAAPSQASTPSCTQAGTFAHALATHAAVSLTYPDGHTLVYQRVARSSCPNVRVFYSDPEHTAPDGTVCSAVSTWLGPLSVSDVAGGRHEVLAATTKAQLVWASGVVVTRIHAHAPINDCRAAADPVAP